MKTSDTFQPDETLSKILSLLHSDINSSRDILLLWIYGSRAKQNATRDSDYDIAVCFSHKLDSATNNRLRPEEIALDWQALTGQEISVVDINLAPTRLAFEIIDTGLCIYCKDPLRLATEELKAHRSMEIDINHHSQKYNND